jgi:hypothetical protein
MTMIQAKTGTAWRKTLLSALLGATAGGLGMFGVLELGGAAVVEAMSLSGLLAIMVGVVYTMSAVGVGLGAAFPALGVRFLNLEDIDEAREVRRVLLYSAAGMGAFGLALVLLAFNGAAGPLPPGPVLVGAAALIVIASGLSVAVWRMSDELMRGLSRETAGTSFYLLTLAGGGWAMLAHLGFVGGPAPLDWLTMIAGLMLVGALIATGRAGLLKPR